MSYNLAFDNLFFYDPGKSGISLSQKEMRTLVDDLFNALQPNSTANGTPTYIEFKKEYLEQMFRKG